MKKITALLLVCMLALTSCTAAETDESTTSSQPATETSETTGETEPVPADNPDGDIVVLFTSDVHSGFDENFGYVGLAQIRDQLTAAGDNVILVDDGDSIQGEPIATMTRGEANIELMNEMGYDVAIPGNHEFDYGMDRFLELAGMAEFPYISCNLNRDGELLFEPYIIKEIGGKKIAFVGVTTPESMTSSCPRNFQDDQGNYLYDLMGDSTGNKLYSAVQQAVDDARSDGADYVIVMGHLGNQAECEPWTYADVISHTRGIDALLDGHSHDIDKVGMENIDGETVIRQACGIRFNGIGWLRINNEDGGIDTELYKWDNDVPAPELFGITNSMSGPVSEAVDTLNEQLSQVVAHSDHDLVIYDPVAVSASGKPIRIVRSAETNLGDLCADAFLDQSDGADIALVNGGGIRIELKEGDITMDDIMTLFPFGNMMTVAEVTGQQILDALEWANRAVPEEGGGFFHVAGMTFEIHTYIPSSCTSDENGLFTGVTGEYRVKNVMVGGEPLDLNRTYKVVSTDYTLLNVGDGNTSFNGCNVLQDSVKLDNQVLVDYITGTLGGHIGSEYEDPYGQGRIVAVDGE